MGDRRRLRFEQGSVLLLFPAAVLIVIVLASLAVDRAVVFQAQRDLVATAEAAANDAASVGLDPDALREGGMAYDPARIDRAVRAAAVRADGDVAATWIRRGDVIEVRLVRTVAYVFARGIPGGRDGVELIATATARLVIA